MPGGLNQMVGETGRQLSHGERSRIFLARALLQDAEFTILDESFAALDAESLRLCLDCAFRRARTLLVIAHPYESSLDLVPTANGMDRLLPPGPPRLVARRRGGSFLRAGGRSRC